MNRFLNVAVLSMSGASGLESRLKSMLDVSVVRHRPSRAVVRMSFSIFLIVCGVIGSARLVAQTETKPRTTEDASLRGLDSAALIRALDQAYAKSRKGDKAALRRDAQIRQELARRASIERKKMVATGGIATIGPLYAVRPIYFYDNDTLRTILFVSRYGIRVAFHSAEPRGVLENLRGELRGSEKYISLLEAKLATRLKNKDDFRRGEPKESYRRRIDASKAYIAALDREIKRFSNGNL